MRERRDDKIYTSDPRFLDYKKFIHSDDRLDVENYDDSEDSDEIGLEESPYASNSSFTNSDNCIANEQLPLA